MSCVAPKQNWTYSHVMEPSLDQWREPVRKSPQTQWKTPLLTRQWGLAQCPQTSQIDSSAALPPTHINGIAPLLHFQFFCASFVSAGKPNRIWNECCTPKKLVQLCEPLPFSLSQSSYHQLSLPVQRPRVHLKDSRSRAFIQRSSRRHRTYSSLFKSHI